MPDNKKGVGMAKGMAPSIPMDKIETQRSGNTDYDGIPNYLAFIKSVQDNNNEAIKSTIQRVMQSRGPETAKDLMWLARDMKTSNIGDLAKRNKSANPEMQRLYQIINENPDVVNKFEYFLPTSGGMANSLTAANK